MKTLKELIHNAGDFVFLKYGLLVVLFQLILISSGLVFGTHDNIYYALHRYHKMLQYIFADVAVLLGSNLLFWVIKRNYRHF